MIFQIVFIAVLFLLTCVLISSVFKLEDRVTNAECKVYKLEELREQEIASLSSQVAAVKEEFEALKEMPAPEEMTIEDQLNEERVKNFSEWIQNIVNYDPCGGK